MANTGKIKDQINNKSNNEWFKKLVGMIKYIENPKLYKYITGGGWVDSWAIEVFADPAKGVDLGFGNQNGISTYPVRMCKAKFEYSKGFSDSKIMKTATIHPTKLANGERMVSSGSFNKQEVCVAYKDKNGNTRSALDQVSLLANYTVYSMAEVLHKSIANNSETASWLDTMEDYELCAIVDVFYNCGASWSKKETLKATVGAHQKAKKSGVKADIDTTLAAVKDAFMLYAGAEGVTDNTSLKIRRTKDANMYGGGLGGMAYDTDANYSTWKSIMNNNYKDIPAGALISISMNEAVKEDAAYSSIMAMTGAGYSPTLYAMIGSGASMTEIEKTIKAEDLAARNKDALRASKVNAKGVTADIQSGVNDDINNLEFLADMRALSGLTIPTSIPYSRENGMSDTDRSRANMTHNYGMFKKYKHTNDEDLGQAKTTWFFLTRPDMCLYQNTNTANRRANANFRRPSLQCADQDLIDHLILDRDLYIYLDRNVTPEHTDTNVCFIPSFTNQFKTASLPEARFDMAKSAANINGVAVNIPTYNSSDTADTEIPVTFNVDNEMSIIKYIDLIFKYAKSVKEGSTIPYKEAVKYNVIDFSMSMFAFVVSQDGVTLESMYRSVGVVPSVNPVSSIPLSSSPEKMDGVTISFKTNTNLDSRKMSIITHFNLLNRYGCSYLTLEKPIGNIKTYDDAIDWYCLNYNIIEAFVQDNMTAEDWYCERFIIFLDTNSKRENGGVYKLIGVPTLKRLSEIIDFLLNKSYNTFYNTLIVREGDASKFTEYKMRPGVNTVFYKRIPDIGKIKTETEKFVKDFDSTKTFYKGWQEMARQADLDMRGDSEFYRNPGTGIRVLSNSKDKGTDGTMIFNLFKVIDKDLPKRNNMYDLFLDDAGVVRKKTPAWLTNFYTFLDKSLLNQGAGKITNVITYAITSEMTYSLDGKSVDPLKSNLGAVAVSDNGNSVYRAYRGGMKTSLVAYTEDKETKKYGVTTHKFNTIDKIESLGLFVDGLYSPKENDASIDINKQLEALENSDTMKALKSEELKFRSHVAKIKDVAQIATIASTPYKPVRFKFEGILDSGINTNKLTSTEEGELVNNKPYMRSMISRGASYLDIYEVNDFTKNLHYLKEMSTDKYKFIDRLMKNAWENMKSSRAEFNNETVTPNPFNTYLSIQADESIEWKENSGVAPYFITKDSKLKVYNTKAVRVKKDFATDKTLGNNPSTKNITKVASVNDVSNISQEAYLRYNSDNRYELMSFMNDAIFQKKFKINDWMSFYSPQEVNSTGLVGAKDSVDMSDGDKILTKYHNIMATSEWTTSSPVRYSSKGMKIHYSIGDIPEDKLSEYSEFIGYYDNTLDSMSDGAVIEKKNSATGEYDRTDKAKKLFSYYPEEADITPKEVREKNSWITKEGWKARGKEWWGNAKHAALETFWSEAITLGTMSLEKLVRSATGDVDKDRKDGRPVTNADVDIYNKSYVKIIERTNVNKPRALYFRDPSTYTIKSGLPEIKAEAEIKPIPSEYYRSSVKMLSPDIQNNIAKIISEDHTTTKKILKLLNDL